LTLLDLGLLLLKPLDLVLEAVEGVQIGWEDLMRVGIGFILLMQFVPSFLLSYGHAIQAIFTFLKKLKLLLNKSILFHLLGNRLSIILTTFLPKLSQ
jgi:hypothetical protein